MSSAIRNLMEAGFTSVEDKDGNQVVAKDTKMEDWFKYTYLSSGCLFAKSCQAALELANHSEENKTHAFNFGKHWANAYQVLVHIKFSINNLMENFGCNYLYNVSAVSD